MNLIFAIVALLLSNLALGSNVYVGESSTCAKNEKLFGCTYSTRYSTKLYFLDELQDIKDVLITSELICAVNETELYCWSPQLSEGQRLPILKKMNIYAPMKLISAGRSICVLNQEGLQCIGESVSPEISQIPQELTSPVDIFLENNYSQFGCGRNKNSQFVCWGKDTSTNVPSRTQNALNAELLEAQPGSVIHDGLEACGLMPEGKIKCTNLNREISQIDSLGLDKIFNSTYGPRCGVKQNLLQCWDNRDQPVALPPDLQKPGTSFVGIGDGFCYVNLKDEVICRDLEGNNSPFGPIGNGIFQKPETFSYRPVLPMEFMKRFSGEWRWTTKHFYDNHEHTRSYVRIIFDGMTIRYDSLVLQKPEEVQPSFSRPDETFVGDIIKLDIDELISDRDGRVVLENGSITMNVTQARMNISEYRIDDVIGRNLDGVGEYHSCNFLPVGDKIKVNCGASDMLMSRFP